MKGIGFIGGGNMAQALIEGVLKQRLFKSSQIWVSDVRAERLAELREHYGLQIAQDNTEIARQAKIIVLSVKPQMMNQVLHGIAGQVQQDALVISIAAGIRTDTIRQKLGEVQIIRVMPNTPALVGAGASGIFAGNASEASVQIALRIFSSVGKAVVVEQEELIDAVTAVSGSGPAYFFLLMEEMMRAAVEFGLDEKTASELVLQTAKGAALLAEAGQANREMPAALRKKVTSPGGTTEAAIRMFEQAGFDAIVMKALAAARDRSRELAR
ncbi:MAG: pyrroline-5-carboxylate reductase [Planctomycetaceae bacterium]|nr:pyrroline-5-carboxylate reductase [Planctomycetaceae bacterium]